MQQVHKFLNGPRGFGLHAVKSDADTGEQVHSASSVSNVLRVPAQPEVTRVTLDDLLKRHIEEGVKLRARRRQERII